MCVYGECCFYVCCSDCVGVCGNICCVAAVIIKNSVCVCIFSLRAGSQVFALLMLFICVILHTMWSGKSLQLLCILPFDIIVFVCHQNDVCEN